MNFESILNQWEMQTRQAYGKKRMRKDSRNTATVAYTVENTQEINPMDYWVRRYGVYDKDAQDVEEAASFDNQTEKRRLRAMRPQAEIDLHGMTLEEAYGRSLLFLMTPFAETIKKYSSSTGKGIIPKMVRYWRDLSKNFWKHMPMPAKQVIPKVVTEGRGQRGLY